MRKSSASLSTVCEDVLRGFEKELSLREIAITSFFDLEDSERISTDVRRFRRVLKTLLGLVVAHTLHGPIQLSAMYYDTKKETILITLTFGGSFLTDDILRLLV